jgi:2-octaprenylphenol hydroxylase
MLPTERCQILEGMSVWEHDGTGEINFEAAEADMDCLEYVVESGVLANALGESLLRYKDLVHIYAPDQPAQLENRVDGVCLSLRSGVQLRAPWLLAADGARSKVRELAGFQWFERSPGQTALVCTLSHERSHGNRALQRFLHSGPVAFLPLRGPKTSAGENDRLSSVVWSLDDALAEELFAMDELEFRNRLSLVIEHRLGALGTCSARSRFPLRYATARTYVRDRVVLLGDAAHAVHPMAGMGLNLGLRDVATLARALKTGSGEHISLREYRAQRFAANTGMVFGLEALRRLYAVTSPELRWLRNIGTTRLARSKSLRRALMRYVA